MRPGRVAALVIGCLLVIPSVAVLLSGAALGLGHVFGRGDDGYFDATIERVETDTVAVTAGDITFATEPGSPDWLIDALDTDVRLRVTGAADTGDVFAGIGRGADVDAYLAGVAHVEVTELADGLQPVYRAYGGADDIAPPTDQDVWAVSAHGPGTQEVEWEARSGRWSVVVMNADGAPGASIGHQEPVDRASPESERQHSQP